MSATNEGNAGAGHTPGEWHADLRDDGYVYAGAGPCVARVFDGDSHPFLDLTDEELATFDRQAPANARLIAAAPALLAALAEYVEADAASLAEINALNAHMDGGGKPSAYMAKAVTEGVHRLNRARESARNAISRAGGSV